MATPYALMTTRSGSDSSGKPSPLGPARLSESRRDSAGVSTLIAKMRASRRSYR